MRIPSISFSFLLLLLLSSCASAASPGGSSEATPVGMSLTLTSPAFAQGAAIPQKYSCKGEGISPPLDWSAPPEGTKSLALIVDDPDAPIGTFVHWVIYNLPADARGLPERASSEAAPGALPQGAVQGKNGSGERSYTGPCPPYGTHRYFFRLYALDSTLSAAALDKDGLLTAMNGHILAQGELMGTFGK